MSLPQSHGTQNFPPEAAQLFAQSDEGSGVFGQWRIDEFGLPAYAYKIDQFRNPAAKYRVSDGSYRCDHWHQIGNDRITGFASNDGVVKAFVADRGAMLLNQYEAGEVKGWLGAIWEIIKVFLYAPIRWIQTLLLPEDMRPTYEPGFFKRLQMAFSSRNIDGYFAAQHAYVGGYAYVWDGSEAWATAYRYQPSPLDQPAERIFGMGYFKTVTYYRSIRVTRTIYAPTGDAPVLLVDALIENMGDHPADLRYYEYWDVNIQQLTVQLLRSGISGAIGDAARRELNLQFTSSIAWDESANALRFRQNPPADAPAPDKVDQVNWYPADVFLADLCDTPTSVYTDKVKFFGQGGAVKPDTVVSGREGEVGAPVELPLMPYCMVMRHDLHLEPGEKRLLRFGYGTVGRDDTFNFLDEFRVGDPLMATMQSWKKQLAYFRPLQDVWLQREMAWHAYYLLSSTVYNAFYATHVTPQGSAYLYLQGSDGAPRDQALFAVALSYLRPSLAKEVLKLIMQVTDGKTGQMQYAYAGFGIAGGAGVHNSPSDLDMFFFLALLEYIAATGDVDFLYEEVPFYPAREQPADTTVLNHIRVAFKHLIDDVGLGADKLIRIRDGDWSDSVVLENVLRVPPIISFSKTFRDGESVPNSQMALYVLPRIAKLLAAQDRQEARDLAAWMQDKLDSVLPQLRDGIASQWTGQWYTRAILRSWWFNRKVVLYKKAINLEAQVWALISRLNGSDKLADTIYEVLDKESPTGCPTTSGGEVWPAISQLLTWGYTYYRPDLAWNSLKRNSFAAHSDTFPDLWLALWSGPDGVYCKSGKNPGGTWLSPVTPMTDFPVMNNNQDTMALLGMLRVCGIEPSENGDGLRITPRIPEQYNLDLPLLKLDVSPGCVSGEYRAYVTGYRRLYIFVPENSPQIEVILNGHKISVVREDDYVVLQLRTVAGMTDTFEVTWT